MIAPTSNRITQGQHLASRAVDHSAKPDPIVYAPEDGTITSYARRGSGTSDAGNMLRLKGATGLHSFAHLEKSLVSVGSKVKQGQPIAVMGHTGYTIPSGPAGAHLHYYVQTAKGYVYPPLLYQGYPKKELSVTKVPDKDNYYWRYGQKLAEQVRGRQLSRTEFRKYLVGQTDLRVVEILSDNKEADQNTADARLGKKARTDNWEKQIVDNKAKVTELTKENKSLNDQIVKLAAENTKLKAMTGDTNKWETLGALLRELLGLNK